VTGDLFIAGFGIGFVIGLMVMAVLVARSVR
jgi:hypothetical protein